MKTAFSILLMTSALLFAGMLLSTHDARAGIGDLSVLGTVTDSAGTPISGASVLIEIVERSYSTSATTGSDGKYQGEVPPDKWDEGNTVRVSVTYGGDTEVRNQPITSEIAGIGIVYIDVKFTFEIPEFGSLFGLIIAGTAVAVLAAMLVTRRRR